MSGDNLLVRSLSVLEDLLQSTGGNLIVQDYGELNDVMMSLRVAMKPKPDKWIYLFGEDDCAPDGRAYFNGKLNSSTGLTVSDFRNAHGKVTMEHGMEYHLGSYKLTIESDDPYYKLYLDRDSILVRKTLKHQLGGDEIGWVTS